jgi:hypothetical protein
MIYDADFANYHQEWTFCLLYSADVHPKRSIYNLVRVFYPRPPLLPQPFNMSYSTRLDIVLLHKVGGL